MRPVRVLATTLAADFELPGPPTECDPELTFVRRADIDRASVSWRDEPSPWPRIGFTPDAVHFAFDDVLIVRYRPGSDVIEYVGQDELSPELLVHLLFDNVLPRVLACNGCRVLHGSVSVGPSGAVVLLGHSGSGKSTLAAALATAGFPMLSDDGVVLAPVGDGFRVEPSYGGYRLRPDAIDAVLGPSSLRPPLEAVTGKHRFDALGRPELFASSAAALTAIVDLAYGQTAPALVPLGPVDAFAHVTPHAFDVHRPGAQPGVDALDKWGPVIAAVQCYRLVRPQDLRRIGESVELLVDRLLTRS